MSDGLSKLRSTFGPAKRELAAKWHAAEEHVGEPVACLGARPPGGDARVARVATPGGVLARAGYAIVAVEREAGGVLVLGVPVWVACNASALASPFTSTSTSTSNRAVRVERRLAYESALLSLCPGRRCAICRRATACNCARTTLARRRLKASAHTSIGGALLIGSKVY